jgi:hypothetical protein
MSIATRGVVCLTVILACFVVVTTAHAQSSQDEEDNSEVQAEVYEKGDKFSRFTAGLSVAALQIYYLRSTDERVGDTGVQIDFEWSRGRWVSENSAVHAWMYFRHPFISSSRDGSPSRSPDTIDYTGIADLAVGPGYTHYSDDRSSYFGVNVGALGMLAITSQVGGSSYDQPVFGGIVELQYGKLFPSSDGALKGFGVAAGFHIASAQGTPLVGGYIGPRLIIQRRAPRE